jgi:hypothetical protein
MGTFGGVPRALLTVSIVVLAALLAGCGSGKKATDRPLRSSDVQAAFGGQGIQLMEFSGPGQLVSSAPPTVEVEILASEAEAKADSAPQQVNGIEVRPIGARNVVVWVDSHASSAFQQRIDAALADLQQR